MENPDSNADDVQSVLGRQGEDDAVTIGKKQIHRDDISPNVGISWQSQRAVTE